MYVNYGDKDFFEHGRLVDAEHEDNIYDILCCNPYPDEPGLFQFGHCKVDITDTWHLSGCLRKHMTQLCSH